MKFSSLAPLAWEHEVFRENVGVKKFHANFYALNIKIFCTAQKAQSPRRLDCAVPNPLDVPIQAGDVRGLSLIKVDSVDQMPIWNKMMIREHPQGAGPLVGCQLRYLITSEHGWLGVQWICAGSG